MQGEAAIGSTDQYLALSYVWPKTHDQSEPQSRSLLLNTSNLEQFIRPGFLHGQVVADEIPSVVKHALALTRLLDERFLWVDRFCIIQDDATAASQISHMNDIYGGAYVTIIAAGNDALYVENVAASSWPAFEPEDHSFARYSSSELLESRSRMIARKLYTTLGSSQWATRGWTFQEQILSKRAIVFTDEGIFWDCQTALWDGIGLKVGTETDQRAEYCRRFETLWWPDFAFYMDLICPYNGRLFTNPQDGLAGISAALRALSPAFPGGFIAGLPRVFLDHALLWQPFGIAKRRHCRQKDGTLTNEPVELPTWSWCAWQCYVDPQSLVSGLAYVAELEAQKRASSWSTQSLVQWSISQDVSSKPVLVKEALEFHHLRARAFSKLPHGWRQHQPPSHSQSHLSFYTKRTFKTPRFSHPIPLNPRDSVSQTDKVPAYLLGSTTAATFGVAASLNVDGIRYAHAIPKGSVFEDTIFTEGPSFDQHCPVLVLQQRSGLFAGLLRSMDIVQSSYGELKLVAVSTGTANKHDLRQSFEYTVYSTRSVCYSQGMKFVDYRPEIHSQTGRKALSCNLDVAFGRRAHVPDKPGTSDVQVIRMPSQNDDNINAGGGFTCEFYNVLWVEEKQGISYRRACGWVPKHIWEANASETDVILG